MSHPKFLRINLRHAEQKNEQQPAEFRDLLCQFNPPDDDQFHMMVHIPITSF